MSDSIIEKYKVYFNTKTLFEAINNLYFSKFSIILAKYGGIRPVMENSTNIFTSLSCLVKLVKVM